MNKPTTIAFETLGCKLNFSETEAISRQFNGHAYKQVGFNEPADIYVIHSCTVTKNADKRTRGLVRQAMKTNPSAHVVVMGCYSEISPGELMAVPGVSMVLGNTEKYQLPAHLNHLEDRTAERIIDPGKKEASATFVPTYSLGNRTRSFFKIQDGCDYKCAYCTIPLARGPSRSDTIRDTLATARLIATSGMKEMVLTGVNIGDFGKPHGETFFGLLQELIKLDGPGRIRLSSIEPDLLHDDIIHLVADEPRLMPHFHIPLQSGSDKILRDMGRRYNTELFANRVAVIRQHIPHACIAADLIVGYPTETEEDFETSRRFIEQTDVSYLHVFPYSEREHTRAMKSPQQVSPDKRKERSKIMQRLSKEKKTQFLNKQKGLKTNVLWEKIRHGDYMYGFSENYIKTKTTFQPEKVNTIEPVILNKQDENGVYIV
ncbi:MAG: tRNA (N(6)-L-threonylcarbamoyladenosine(37)-C(2))-methylthiotransferase MtaB [Bacteroidota bacterium]